MSLSSYTCLKCAQTGGVLEVVLHRPECLNAINLTLLQELNDALAVASRTPEVRAIVLRGEGRAFCAGDDLVAQVEAGALDAARMQQFVQLLQDVTRQLMFGDACVVAVVHGWAIGGGFSWTLNADFSLWARNARAYLPEIGFGMFVSGAASYLLPDLAGHAAACELAMTGQRVSAERLAALGVAGRVTDDDAVLTEGLALAHQLAALPAASAGMFKRAALAHRRDAIEAALRLEADVCMACAHDTQTVKRIEQFLAARP